LKNILSLILLLFCQQATAHKTSDSFVTVNLLEKQPVIHWSIAIRDLEIAIGIDRNADRQITWQEVLSTRSVIEAYVRSHLSLYESGSENNSVCSININNLQVDNLSDGSYLVFSIQSPCLTDVINNNIVIDYQLLFNLDKNHRGHIAINTASGITTYIAKPDRHVFSFHGKQDTDLTVMFHYVNEGIWHILIGFDHILFLLALLLPSVLVYNKGQWKHRENIRDSFFPVLKIVTAFTIAHSITLTLSVLKILNIPSQWIEVTIAVTVLITCLHTIKPIFQHSLWRLAFVFGLVHGFGFANVLLDLGLDKSALITSLLGFNIGVEVGQLLIVIVFMLFAMLAHQRWWYRVLIFRGGVLFTAVVSCIWIVERFFNYELLVL